LALVVVALGLMPAGASATFDPGRVLVRFRGGVDANTRGEVARHVGLEIGDQLPLVPDLYELRVPTGENVGRALRLLARTTDEVVKDNVVYAQPDDFISDAALTTPQDAAYWPNDPYFWAAKYPNVNGCRTSQRLVQWGLWP